MEDLKKNDVTIPNEVGTTVEGVTSAPEQVNIETAQESQETIDWKKRAEEVERELEQAKFTLKQKNIAEKESRKKVDFEDSFEDQEEDEIPKEKISEIVQKELEKAQISMRTDIISEELARLTSDPDEMRVIQMFYENKIVKSGFDRTSIKKDLEFAQALANKPRLMKVAGEIQKKKESESAMSTAGGSGGQKINSDSAAGAELSDADKRIMAKFGLKPEDIKS